jgi:hypothetical protein
MTEGNLGYYLKMEALRVSGSTWSTNLERFLTETLRVRGKSLRMPQVAASCCTKSIQILAPSVI